ncbi:MAG TPA: hypothetical protein VN914_01555 [Polyangia bacterium]|jgi:hypothetical protein|nr:hypothetical protein [Polyangia bacterium]
MRKRSVIALLVVALLVGGGAIAWRALHLSDLTRIGTGYAALQTCACLFISHRPAESCHQDLDPLARRLISVRPGADQVTARSFLVIHATARYQKGLGCSLED